MKQIRIRMMNMKKSKEGENLLMKLIEKGPWSIDQSTRYKVFEYNQHVEQNQDGTKSYHDCLKVFDGCTLVANIEEWSGRVWIYGKLQEITNYSGKSVPITTLLITDDQIQVYCEDMDEVYLLDLNKSYEKETVKNESESDYEEFKKYDIIKHFKYETLTDEMQKQHIYIYQVLMTSVLDTETDEKLIIYKALYNGKLYGMDSGFGQVFARPEKMFYEEVNQEKYPNIDQKHRFELVRHMDHEINEKEVNKLKI